MVTYEDFIDGVMRCKGPAKAIDQRLGPRWLGLRRLGGGGGLARRHVWGGRTDGSRLSGSVCFTTSTFSWKRGMFEW